MKPHTAHGYDEELQGLCVAVSNMGVLAASMVRDASRALFLRDPELARSVIRDEERMDMLEVETDQRAVDLIARRAPVGPDLRFVMAVLKSVTELERVGDLARNLARRALELISSPGINPPPEVRALADAAVAQLERAVSAWRTKDPALARTLADGDRMVDHLNRSAFATLIRITQDHPDQFERALALSSVCRYLERSGDHAVNLGEAVVYWVEGAETRHGRGGTER